MGRAVKVRRNYYYRTVGMPAIVTLNTRKSHNVSCVFALFSAHFFVFGQKELAMRKGNKILSIFMVLAIVMITAISFAACDNSSQSNLATYKTVGIKVVDIDGEVIVNDDNVQISDKSTLLDLLKNNYAAVATASTFGNYLVSVKGSVVDKNWSLMLYENGKMSDVGIDGIVVDNNDKFEFRVECWNTVASGYGTMDDIDVKVDRTIYKYFKLLKNEIYNKRTTIKDSGFWDDMFLYNIGKSYFGGKVELNASQEFLSVLENTDLSTLTGANWGKFYYAAKANGIDLTDFKVAYQSYINTITGAFNCWSTPFEISFAKALNVTSEALQTLIANTNLSNDTGWGPDAAVWQNTCLSIYKNFVASDFEFLSNKSDWGNATNIALPLMLYSANNMNIREIQKTLTKDCVELLFEKAYNQTSNLLLLNSAEPITSPQNMSVNQIYASLLSYKIMRDGQTAFNILA